MSQLLLMFCMVRKKKYILLMFHNSNREKKVILLMISNGEKRKAKFEECKGNFDGQGLCDYLAVKN